MRSTKTFLIEGRLTRRLPALCELYFKHMCWDYLNYATINIGQSDNTSFGIQKGNLQSFYAGQKCQDVKTCLAAIGIQSYSRPSEGTV